MAETPDHERHRHRRPVRRHHHGKEPVRGAQRAGRSFVRTDLARRSQRFPGGLEQTPRREGRQGRQRARPRGEPENRGGSRPGQKRMYDTLVNRKGDISDTINAQAELYSKAKTKGQRDAIKQRTVETVRDAVFREAGVGAADRGGKSPGVQGGAQADPVEPGAAAGAKAPDAPGGSAEPGGLTAPAAAAALVQPTNTPRRSRLTASAKPPSNTSPRRWRASPRASLAASGAIRCGARATTSIAWKPPTATSPARRSTSWTTSPASGKRDTADEGGLVKKGHGRGLLPTPNRTSSPIRQRPKRSTR